MRQAANDRLRAGLRFGKRLAIRARAELSPGLVPGMLSIVVPVYNVERYLAECIESLLAQEYVNTQLIFVDDGSPDGSAEIVRRYAKRDPRIKLIRQQNAGPSAARNNGITHARGEFLTFFDSDDFVGRRIYSDAIASLQESGSDLAVLAYQREKNGSILPAAPWIRAAHATNRSGVTLADYPEIMVNTIATSKVYRRTFWDAQKFEFPEGLLFEDQALTMSAFTSAQGIDVRSYVGINWRIRGGSTTHNATQPRNLRDHHTAVQRSLEILEENGLNAARDLRIVQLMNNNFGDYLRNIGRMEGESWDIFREAAQYLVERVNPAMSQGIEARKKVLFALTVANQRDLALEFLQRGGWNRDDFGGSVHGRQIIAQMPLREEIAPFVTEQELAFATPETELETALRGITVTDQGSAVEVQFFAHVNHLRMDVEDLRVEATLVAPDGTRSELAVARYRDAVAALNHTRRYADNAMAAAAASIPADLLTTSGDYVIEVSIVAGAFARSGSLLIDGRTVFAIAALFDGGRRLCAFEGSDGAVATLRVTTPQAKLLSAQSDDTTLHVEIECHLSDVNEIVLLDRRGGDVVAASAVTDLGDDRVTAAVALPDLERGPHEYILAARRLTRELVFPVDAREPGTAELAGPQSVVQVVPQLHARREPAGRVLVVDLRGAALVTGVSLGDTELRLDVTLPKGALHLASVSAGTRPCRVDSSSPAAGERVHVVLPLTEDLWGTGRTAIAPGRFEFEGTTADGSRVPFYLSGKLVAEFPIVQYGELVRLTVMRSAQGLLVCSLQPPQAPEEQGYGNRARMRDRFLTLQPGGQRSIVFRNLYGEAANDSALALHRELRRRGSDLELIWAVKDRSVPVPEDATVVVEETRAYYEALGTAQYFMVNVHQPDWYVKPAGQVLIQTFHGYPFKLNGKQWWDKVGFDSSRQESLLRRAQEWDYLVSPAKYATGCLLEFYRDANDVAGDILEIGYPRNDALLNDSADARRAAVRERLGIQASTKAILYAPTFRDYMSADDFTAEMVELLNVERLVAALGAGYTLLLRGHPFNARVGTSASDKVIDVTDYPDINDLILASDMAVLDYSSLRFDYALTAKPVFYYVPDEDTYFHGRGSLVPYEDTTPGPLVRSQSELEGLIRRAEEVAAQHEPERREFLARYMELEDGHATARLIDTVFAPRGDA
ncbi:bifunctional glycosyltransferase/CDP-glycerol:glycerophosphate glycerophosphotransferase [Leucobacter sp. HY1910]